MCCNVYIAEGGQRIDKAGQLAALVGPENVLQYIGDTEGVEPVDQEDLQAHANSCMCWIAIDETLERAGYHVDFDGLDYTANLSPKPPIL